MESLLRKCTWGHIRDIGFPGNDVVGMILFHVVIVSVVERGVMSMFFNVTEVE